MSPRMGPLPAGPSTPALLQSAQSRLGLVRFLERCRQRYGEVFSIRLANVGPLVVVSSPEAIRRVLGADESSRGIEWHNALRPMLGPRSLFFTTGAEHAERRRALLPPFRADRVRACTEAVEAAVESDLERWPIGRPFALLPRLQAIALDVMMRVVFGAGGGEGGEELRRRLRRMLAQWRRSGLALRERALRLPWIGAGRQRLIATTRAMLRDAVVRRRGAGPAAGDDVLSHLLGARPGGAAMDDDEVRDHVATLLIAGHETTAAGLAWAFDLLLHHPDALRGLCASGAGGEFGRAVVRESLRLRTVVPSFGRRLAVPVELDGHTLPAETAVLCSAHLAHTRPASYPEPLAFRPERFAGVIPDPFAWIPFGGGGRRCLGAELALLEMETVLPCVLRRLVLRPATATPESAVLRGVVLAPRHGVRVVAQRRRGG